MTVFKAKTYQAEVLKSIEAYFRTCHEAGTTPSRAFTAVTEALWSRGQVYNPLPDLPSDMPYFCLRVPTGGGKTWIAAKSVALVNSQLLRTEHSVILWLVPSTPIREQTLRALKDLEHPYHAALRDAGPVTVMDLDEAKSINRATLDTSTVVIVATRQAFQVENDEIRKVYQSSGALMHHFDNLKPEQTKNLLRDENGDGMVTPYSLANVLRLRRPFIIVDEAHNSRTELAFDTLGRFRPSGIMELTATPDMERTPSNVLHSVSAAELKQEEMIKLPILLETEPNAQQCMADAIARRESLDAKAVKEQRAGAPYLRPVVLIQAEARRAGVDTRDVDWVKDQLMRNHNIPEEEIAIATGEHRGIEKIDEDFDLGIVDPDCPVKFVITQRALAEGWDCPFAYILVSMASMRSATAVEQILGRILRQPDAKRREETYLNQSYAFVVSRNFSDTAKALRDRLVEGSGFDRKEAAEFVQATKAHQDRLDLDRYGDRIQITPVEVALTKKPEFKGIPKSIKDKVHWDSKRKTLVIKTPLEEGETETLTRAQSAETASAINEAAEVSRAAVEHFETPAERGEQFEIPMLQVRAQGELRLFDDPELLDYEWDLSAYDAAPTHDDIQRLGATLKVSEAGLIDTDEESGRIHVEFLPHLQRDLGLVYRAEHWDEVKLVAWLCRNLPDPTSTHAQKQAFVAGWLDALLDKDGFELAKANLLKFQIRLLLEQTIRNLQRSAVRKAFQQTLFGDKAKDNAAVNAAEMFSFNPDYYAPARDYDERYTDFRFKKHYFARIGDFDSEEEFECACWLDTQAQKGKIDFWIRNLVRREGCSFFLQKADGRFYPDFLCKLPDGTILVVEYKGSDRWEGAKDDRLIGDLWAELSDGACRFVMVRNREWGQIDALLG